MRNLDSRVLLSTPCIEATIKLSLARAAVALMEATGQLDPQVLLNLQDAWLDFFVKCKDDKPPKPPTPPIFCPDRYPVLVNDPRGYSNNRTCEKVVAVAKGATVGYIAYRCFRMIPSLFPPLWETIPINAAAP